MGQRGVRNRRTLFEREGELAAADEALNELTGLREDGTEGPERPRGALLAFAGRAGIGKTTLLAEVRRRAAARGCTVLSARGGDQEQGVAFHVARQLLQPQFAGSPEAEIRAQLGSWYAIVGPALGLCAPSEGAAPDPQGLRDGLDWVLTHLAVQRAPMVLVLDDAHWADPESLSWLAAFAPRAEELPLLLTVAYRPDELPDHAEAFRGLPGRAGQRPLDLEPLSAAAVAGLVREDLGTGADDVFCRECWAVTAGNPFEAVELTAKVRDRGLVPTEEGAHLLRDLAAAVKGSGLIARLERLGASTVRFAWACAVLGTEIPPTLAAAVAGLGSEEAADAADALRGARILAGADTLEFVHPLIATAVYRAIPGAVRVALHGQAAWCVIDEGLGPSAAARHLMETHPEGDNWVVQQLRAAARETQRAGAPDAARRYLARALREPPPLKERAAVLHELGCASLLTEPATTVNHLRAALEEPISDPELRHNIVYRLSQVLAHSDRLVEASETLAREIRVTGNARVRLRMQSEQFMWDAFRADEPDSPARSRRLSRLADRLTGRDLTERYVIGLRAWDATLRGEPAHIALHHAERALAGEFRWAEADRGFEVPALVALTFMYADRPGRTEELFAAGIADFESQGWHGAHLSFGYTLLAYVRYRRGRLAEAEDFARAGLRLAERVGAGTPSTGTPSVSSSRSCSPAAVSPRPPRSARTTRSARRSRPPSPSPTSRPCTANCCSPAASPRTPPPSSRRPGAAWTRAASATPPGVPGSSTSPAPKATTRRNAPSPRHSKRYTAPASSAPPRPSGRPCGPRPTSPPARPASSSSKSPSATWSAPRPPTNWPARWSPWALNCAARALPGKPPNTSTEDWTRPCSAAPTGSATRPAPSWPPPDCARAACTAPRRTRSPPGNARPPRSPPGAAPRPRSPRSWGPTSRPSSVCSRRSTGRWARTVRDWRRHSANNRPGSPVRPNGSPPYDLPGGPV